MRCPTHCTYSTLHYAYRLLGKQLGRFAAALLTVLWAGLVVTTPVRAAIVRADLPDGFTQIEMIQYAPPDLNGVWSDGIAPIHIHQHGRDVEFRYVTNDYDHTFRGHYVSPNGVEGAYTPRRNRTNNCTTTLAVHIDVEDANTFVLHWRALDSNCDLAVGQTGTDAPYVRQSGSARQTDPGPRYVRQSRPSWQAAPGDTSCCPNNMLVCPLGRHFCGH